MSGKREIQREIELTWKFQGREIEGSSTVTADTVVWVGAGVMGAASAVFGRREKGANLKRLLRELAEGG